MDMKCKLGTPAFNRPYFSTNPGGGFSSSQRRASIKYERRLALSG
jgi:hypothetical protein